MKDFFHESFANIISKEYTIEYIENTYIKEELYEAKISFVIVLKIIKLWIKAEIIKQNVLLNLINISCLHCKKYLKCVIDASRFIENLYMKIFLSTSKKYKSGPWYKKSVQRDITSLHGLPVNLHLQRMTILQSNYTKADVSSNINEKTSINSTIKPKNHGTNQKGKGVKLYRTLSASNFEIAAFGTVHKSARYRKSSEAEFLKWGEIELNPRQKNEAYKYDEAVNVGADEFMLDIGGKLFRKKSLSTSDLIRDNRVATTFPLSKASNIDEKRMGYSNEEMEGGASQNYDTITVGAFSVSGSRFLEDYKEEDVNAYNVKPNHRRKRVIDNLVESFKKISKAFEMSTKPSNEILAPTNKPSILINGNSDQNEKEDKIVDDMHNSNQASLFLNLPHEPIYHPMEAGMSALSTTPEPKDQYDLCKTIDQQLIRFDHALRRAKTAYRSCLDSLNAQLEIASEANSSIEKASFQATQAMISHFINFLQILSKMVSHILNTSTEPHLYNRIKSMANCGRGCDLKNEIKSNYDACHSVMLELEGACDILTSKFHVLDQVIADETSHSYTSQTSDSVKKILLDLKVKLEECYEATLAKIGEIFPLTILVVMDCTKEMTLLPTKGATTFDDVLSGHLEVYKENIAQTQALASLSTALVPRLNDVMVKEARAQRDAGVVEGEKLLAVFVSLLSCYKEEKVMIQDMARAIDNIRGAIVTCWSIKGSCEGGRDLFQRIDIDIDGVDGNWLINFYYPQISPDPPNGNREEKLIYATTITPTFFTFGLNEQHILGKYLGDISLQHRLNERALSGFSSYFTSLPEEVPLLVDLQAAIEVNNVAEALNLIHTMTQSCNGLRFTSCKSAKDRTGMSVTLEQSQILKNLLKLTPDQFNEILEKMRKFGVRRYDVFKNVGTWQYAFNKLQYCALPPLFKPPRGCFRSGQT